jgi:hypothetical protein
MAYVDVDLSGVNAADVERQKGGGRREPIEPGEYTVMAVASDLRNAKSDPKNQFIEYKFRVVDGPNKGHEIYENLNIRNKSAKAVEIALIKYRMLAEAVRHPTPTRVRMTEELHNIPFRAKVDIETTNQGSRKNVIKGAEPLVAEQVEPAYDTGGQLSEHENIF